MEPERMNGEGEGDPAGRAPVGGLVKEMKGRVFKPGDLCKGGRYKIFDLLGAGGMCEVWRTFDEQAPDYERQWVAVKVLRSKLSFDDESKSRLEKEARTLLDLQHDNLVRVFHADVDEERNIFFYVMELLGGETLDARIKRTGGLDPGEALRIVAEVAEAAHGLHKLGIVHRDLKPDNIYITDTGRTVVLDLGVAKFDPRRFPDRATQPTGPNTIIGTLAYMSPEQILGSRELDARSDVYALGLIAYACLAGFHPAQGGPGGWMPQDLAQWGGWHVNSSPKPLPLLLTWLHDKVWRVVAKALAKEASQRYRSAAALSADLRGVLAWLTTHGLLERPAIAVATKSGEELSLATTEETTTAAEPRSVEPPRSHRPSVTPPSERPGPRTPNGTEIILRAGPAAVSSAEEEPGRRTAGGTEIIRTAPPSRATLSLVPAHSAARVESEALPERDPRASVNTGAAHAVPIARVRAPRAARPRGFAFGGGGLALGVALTAILVTLVALARRALVPIQGASAASGVSSAPSVPVVLVPEMPGSGAPSSSPALPVASTSASASAASVAATGQVPATSAQGASSAAPSVAPSGKGPLPAQLPPRTVTPGPAPRPAVQAPARAPKSDRILD